jgi:hypothetical protein
MREDTLEYRGAQVRALPRRNRTFGAGRTCAEPECVTRLSIYNRSEFCWQHEPVRTYVARGKRKRREAA